MQENRTMTMENRKKNPTRALTGEGSICKVVIVQRKTSEREMESRNIAMMSAGIKKERTGPNMFSTKKCKMTDRGVVRVNGVRNTGEGVKGRCSCTK